MTDLLVKVLPLALGAAISPAVLIVAVLLLASPRSPRIRTALFCLGGAVTLIAIGIVGLAVLGATEPDPGHTDTVGAWVDTVAGVTLVVLGARLLLVRHRTAGERHGHDAERTQAGGRPVWTAFPIGVVMMLTNSSSLALYVPILKDLSRADVSGPGRIGALAIVDLVILLPALVPLVLTIVAPGPAGRALTKVRDVATRYARALSGAVFLVLGIYLAWRGIRLLT